MSDPFHYEWLDIVNAKDEVISKDTKEEKLAKGLISRSVVVFIKNKNRKLLLINKGLYYPSAYGHVRAGESYEEAAYRVVREELGIICRLRLFNKSYTEFSEPNLVRKYFISIFIGTHTGEVTLSTQLAQYKYFSLREIDKLLTHTPDLFAPGFIRTYQLVKTKLKS